MSSAFFCTVAYTILVDSVSLHKTYTSFLFLQGSNVNSFFCLILHHNDFVPIIFFGLFFPFLGILIWIQISSKKKLISVVRNQYILTKKLNIDEFKINANIKEQYILLCTRTRSEKRTFAVVYVQLSLKFTISVCI